MSASNGHPPLTPPRKAVYALGDVTINTSLASLSLIYASYFLPQVVDLRAALAGLVPLIARTIDAFADPLMGRISDRTPWRAGRRRPWFLIGAIPYGVSFWLLWVDAPFVSTEGRFAYYTAIYVVHALAMTVLTVPYMAILPEMAIDYDARTSLNTYRTVGSIVGVFAAVAVQPIADALGGGKQAYATTAAVFGVAMALPWIAVHRVTFERPEFRTRPSEQGHFESLRVVFFHKAFLQLTLVYIMGRIAMDLAGALLILYTTFWLLRPDDFGIVMTLFLSAVLLALPFWLRLAQGRDKATVFTVGSLWWAATSLGLLAIGPESPRWLIFVYVPIVGFGYAVVDLMPWSMLGEVIDEDDLAHGERREGLYNGVFTFLRKLGGALGVFLVMSILDFLGYAKGETQSETAREAIRWMTGAAPAFFLLAGVLLLRAYPLTRRRHAEILAQLAAREG